MSRQTIQMIAVGVEKDMEEVKKYNMFCQLYYSIGLLSISVIMIESSIEFLSKFYQKLSCFYTGTSTYNTWTLLVQQKVKGTILTKKCYWP